MDGSRRKFFKVAGASLLGLGVSSQTLASGGHGPEPEPADGKRWAMVVDTRVCQEKKNCTACIDACHLTHNVPKIDNPRREVKWIWREPYYNAFPNQVHAFTEPSVKERSVLVLCNHCDRPPCVRVCPTGATFKNDEGIISMDMHRCIGCRYCIAACPYGSRSFNWSDPREILDMDKVNDEYPTRTKGVVEKCNFCSERLAKGQIPACMEACQKANEVGAIFFGDLNDPESEVARMLRTNNSIRRKPNLGTAPNIFYIV